MNILLFGNFAFWMLPTEEGCLPGPGLARNCLASHKWPSICPGFGILLWVQVCRPRHTIFPMCSSNWVWPLLVSRFWRGLWGFSAIPLYLLAGLAFGNGGIAPLT